MDEAEIHLKYVMDVAQDWELITLVKGSTLSFIDACRKKVRADKNLSIVERQKLCEHIVYDLGYVPRMG